MYYAWLAALRNEQQTEVYWCFNDNSKTEIHLECRCSPNIKLEKIVNYDVYESEVINDCSFINQSR